VAPVHRVTLVPLLALGALFTGLAACTDDAPAASEARPSSPDPASAERSSPTTAPSTTSLTRSGPTDAAPLPPPPPPSRASTPAIPPAATTAPARSEPAEFAAREPYPSCGTDESQSLDGVGPASRERQCLLAANVKGAPAELAALEVGALFGGAASVVYRSNPDRSVDVYVVGDPWHVIHCAGLSADARSGFAPDGCGEPVVLG